MGRGACACIGEVADSSKLMAEYDDTVVLNEDILKLTDAFKATLDW